MRQIKLDFGTRVLNAELFDTVIAKKFAEKLPYRINLTSWGNECYGSIEIDLGEEKPVSDIPPGGIAYTNNGNYLCIFFGQKPAWAVEYIGRIVDDQWQWLVENSRITAVMVHPG